MPVFLSFFICTLADSNCHVAQPLEDAFIGVTQCQRQGMLIAPVWQEQHPGWVVKRIRCSIGSPPLAEQAT